MDQGQIVVSRSPEGDGRVRTGALLGRSGLVMTVRWDDDGREEDVRITVDTTFVVPGTLRHEAFVDLAGLTARLESDPVAVFTQLLREHPGYLTATQIKQKLADLRLDQAVLNMAWKKAQAKLKEHHRVKVDGKRYKWCAILPEDTETPAEAQAEPTRSQEQERHGAPATDEAPSTPVTQEVPAAPAPVSDEPEQDVVLMETTADDEEPVPWLQAVAAALRDGAAPDASAYTRRPLATAVRLGRLDDVAIQRLVESVQDDDQTTALALLAALPRGAEPVDERLADIDPAALEAVLVAGAEELRERQPPDRALSAAALRLLRRAAEKPAPFQTAPALIRLAAAVAVDPGKDALAVLDRVVKVVGEHLASVSTKERDAVALDLDTVARLAAVLPFTRHGGRAVLVAAVARAWPERVTEEIWWEGATATALAEAAAGTLSRVTARPDVAERILAPLLARELPNVTSRVRLARLMGMPTEFVQQVPPAAVTNAFRRVAASDPAVEDWLRLLAQDDRMSRLEEELERARTDARLAAERAEQAEARNRDLLGQLERLEARLRETHRQSVSMRAAQERQVKIDAVRSLADLAAEVEELAAGKADPDVVMERVRALASDQELEPIGDVGVETTFDRETHEPLVGAPQDGQTVTVLRPGYRWRSDDENLVLFRALVSVPET
ncbi:hypothetical protein ABZ801_11660 [Actinomadura sp. NPDC047616]|uniref:hypothetical protein n=1 Tax=Actinomadura sp. NPDC047616 TaxID=3155914 RepID=UPI00340BE1D1